MVVYSLVLVLMMIFRPGGLLGSYDLHEPHCGKIMNGELFQESKEGKDPRVVQTKAAQCALPRAPPRQGKPILDVRELGIDFGGLTAVDGFNLMIGLPRDPPV